MSVLKSYNPATGELLGDVPVATEEEIKSVVAKAHQAQKAWGALDIDQRIDILTKAGAELQKESQKIAVLLSREMGKDFRRSYGVVAGSAGSISYVAGTVKEAVQPVAVYGGQATIEYNPIGVCAIISPWNYPVSMAHWMLIPALTAGNAVVLKPSEETPLVALAYVNVLNRVLPEGVLQIVFGDEEQGKMLVKSDVQLIGFTGSMEAGQDIMSSAGRGLKQVIMELGGKDPCIVLDDADLDEAVSFAVANSLENAGQMCISTERVFVESSIYDEFVAKACQYIRYFRVGPFTDQMANVGPIINEHQRQRILDQIDDAVSRGAKIVAGGAPHPDHFINPTILVDVTDDMDIAKYETFGPVVCITKFDDVEDAIFSANNTDFGLGAVVYGDYGAEEVASRLEAGMVGINTGAGGGGDTPWVGAKMSGVGYHGSPDGHRQFTQAKVVNRARW
ncbi:MAG: aldehyde dehydrogenase [Eubacterium sp.]|nr:aldehyde dehydrogenase [Candidatus Colimonas fimequi]